MSDIYTDIEGALLLMLQDAEDLEGVKTWEAGIRDCLFAADKLSRGFHPGELPAVNVTAQLRPSVSRPFSASEKEFEIPLDIAVVTRAQSSKDALAAVREIQNAIESVLDGGRRSGNPLGENTVVTGDVTTDAAAVPFAPLVFGVCQIRATVRKIVEMNLA